MNRILGGSTLSFAALVGLLILFGSWYTVDQSERVVLLRNGAYVEDVQPGLHYKWPLIDTARRISIGTHKTLVDKMESYSADQQPAHLRVSVNYHAAPDHIKSLNERFGGDLAAAVDRLILPNIYKETKIVFGQYTAAKSILDRGPLNDQVARAMNNALVADPVFVIEAVQIEDITFSPEYTKSVEQRMTAEVEVQKLRQNLEREKVQADIAVTQAKGRAESVRAEALASADATKLKGDAEASAIRARASALGDNPGLVALVTAEKWDGKLPATMLPNGTVPLLTLNR